MKKLLVVALFFSTVSFAEETVKELYAPNDAGGYIALTVQPCAIKESRLNFPFMAYSVASNGKRFEACWTVPSMEGAPENAIGVVNIHFQGAVFQHLQSDFKPTKPVEIEIRGDL